MRRTCCRLVKSEWLKEFIPSFEWVARGRSMTGSKVDASLNEITIGLLWHSPNSGNLGVGALTVSNLALAREAAAEVGLKPRFRILGFVDEGPSYVTGPDVDVVALGAREMAPGGVYWNTLADLDCVLDIGGGDSFADIYGAKRFAFLWLAKEMTVARGVPLLLSPQTIGPFTRQPYRLLAAHAMNRATAVVARDPMSFDAAREMSPGAHVIQSVDVAFALPFERRRRKNPKVIEVGVNVSGLLFNGGHTGANEFGLQVDYAEYSRRLIGELQRRAGVSVHLICHVNTDELPHEDDGRVADALAEEFPGVVRGPAFRSPSEAKSYISGLDFLVGGRMHACIAAFSSGVPVVPVAYSRKFSGLFHGVLGYEHAVPVTGMTTEQAVAYTLERLDQREGLKADVVRGNARVDELLTAYGRELQSLFARVARPAAKTPSRAA
jgi:polysaccharide pyruvyl transferase WcaK-like protein